MRLTILMMIFFISTLATKAQEKSIASGLEELPVLCEQISAEVMASLFETDPASISVNNAKETDCTYKDDTSGKIMFATTFPMNEYLLDYREVSPKDYAKKLIQDMMQGTFSLYIEDLGEGAYLFEMRSGYVAVIPSGIKRIDKENKTNTEFMIRAGVLGTDKWESKARMQEVSVELARRIYEMLHGLANE